MKSLPLILLPVLLLVLPAYPALSQDESEIEEVQLLLDEFLEGASVNDIEVHNRFWSEELVYTGSSGQRFSKANIMENLRNAGSGDNDSSVTYSAEEVNIRKIGEVFLLTFRLMAYNPDTDKTDQYYNTGVFHKEKGVLKAIAWQATKIP